jgi:hypothetical protein
MSMAQCWLPKSATVNAVVCQRSGSLRKAFPSGSGQLPRYRNVAAGVLSCRQDNTPAATFRYLGS